MRRLLAITLTIATLGMGCAPTSAEWGRAIINEDPNGAVGDILSCAIFADRIGEAIVWETRRRWLVETLVATAIGAAGGALTGVISSSIQVGKGAGIGAIAGAGVAGGAIMLADRETVKKNAMSLCLQHKGHEVNWGPQLPTPPEVRVTVQPAQVKMMFQDVDMHPIPNSGPDVSGHKEPKK